MDKRSPLLYDEQLPPKDACARVGFGPPGRRETGWLSSVFPFSFFGIQTECTKKAGYVDSV
jgi:hypothetical protein